MELIGSAVHELRSAQTEQWSPPAAGLSGWMDLPPELPIGGGRQVRATKTLLENVASYASLYLDDRADLRPRYKTEEFTQIVRYAYGQTLAAINLEMPDPELADIVRKRVDEKITSSIDLDQKNVEVVLGCHLFKSSKIYPISVGPVRFELREAWCKRALNEGQISAVTARRLQKIWAGSRIKKREPSLDSNKERLIADTIGLCPVVCTVKCVGLSTKMIDEKSLVGARLAICALALTGAHPSRGLEWMGLLHDGRTFHRDYVMFADDGSYGMKSSISQLPEGLRVDGDFSSVLKEYQEIFDQIGCAIANYLQPVKTSCRPNTMSALFLSLWWFCEACRERSDQLATTKFASSLDTLAKGKGDKGILKLVDARLGIQRSEALILSGRTAKEVVEEIY